MTIIAEILSPSSLGNVMIHNNVLTYSYLSFEKVLKWVFSVIIVVYEFQTWKTFWLDKGLVIGLFMGTICFLGRKYDVGWRAEIGHKRGETVGVFESPVSAPAAPQNFAMVCYVLLCVADLGRCELFRQTPGPLFGAGFELN